MGFFVQVRYPLHQIITLINTNNSKTTTKLSTKLCNSEKFRILQNIL